MTRSAGTLAFVLLFLAATASATEKVLARDDGVKAGHRSCAGTGHVIELTAPGGEWWVSSVRIFGARYGGGYDPKTTSFTVTIADPAMKSLGSTTAPYDLFAPGRFGWVDVPLEEPVKVAGTFRVIVAFDPTQTKGIFVGHAVTTESKSGFGLPGGRETRFLAGQEWMIRALLTDEGPKETAGDRVDLALDDGTKTGVRSLGGSGHVVEFRRPSGQWWIDSVRIYGSRYGGGYDPATTAFTVSVTNPAMHPLAEERAPYSLFPAGKFTWARVPLSSPLPCPARFRVAVDFAPGATKGVYVAYSAGRERGVYVGRAGGRVERFEDGIWMIRVVLTKEKPEPREPLLPAALSPEARLADFEFVAKTVAERFPAFEKKGVDWKAVVREFRPEVGACGDDASFLLTMTRLLARLGDSHTGITQAKADYHVPAFDGLFGAGMWIARDGDRFVLRALMSGHPLADRLSPGAELVAVDGRPVAEVSKEVRERVSRWYGWSSSHFLDARLSFEFFPFGERRTLPARFRNPDGGIADVTLTRWGPGGRGLSRIDVTMPEGVEPEGGAVSAKLGGGIGYLRILGGMDETTRAAFFRAFDALKGAKAILLDCRGMGGGGDGAAWAMAGRFFEKRTPHGPVTLEPTGDWQFTGPVVMLTDEREVSSAETFTWAMTETGRAVTVGRPTGGATIIPLSFTVPSGLFTFRLGVTDRKTPGRGVQPEGIGTAPDVFVPYTAKLLKGGRDPVFSIGRELLADLLSGTPREAAVRAARPSR